MGVRAALRDKRFVGSLLDIAAMKPVLHISMRYPASRLCAAPVLPLAAHPHHQQPGDRVRPGRRDRPCWNCRPR
jgi:hypothetical protein